MMVLVHPALGDDPAGMQNQVGRITQANMEIDDIFVSLGETQALYASDALLVFNPRMTSTTTWRSSLTKPLFRY